MPIQDHPRFATINTTVQSLITTIRTKQAEYFTRKGSYFQGLKIPNIACDGMTNIGISPGLHPSDQEDSWATFNSTSFKANTKLPVQIRLDVYQSTEGWGWILRIEMIYPGIGPDGYGHDGDVWTFQHNEGPEQYQGVWDDWFIEVRD